MAKGIILALGILPTLIAASPWAIELSKLKEEALKRDVKTLAEWEWIFPNPVDGGKTNITFPVTASEPSTVQKRDVAEYLHLHLGDPTLYNEQGLILPLKILEPVGDDKTIRIGRVIDVNSLSLTSSSTQSVSVASRASGLSTSGSIINSNSQSLTAPAASVSLASNASGSTTSRSIIDSNSQSLTASTTLPVSPASKASGSSTSGSSFNSLSASAVSRIIGNSSNTMPASSLSSAATEPAAGTRSSVLSSGFSTSGSSVQPSNSLNPSSTVTDSSVIKSSGSASPTLSNTFSTSITNNNSSVVSGSVVRQSLNPSVTTTASISSVALTNGSSIVSDSASRSSLSASGKGTVSSFSAQSTFTSPGAEGNNTSRKTSSDTSIRTTLPGEKNPSSTSGATGPKTSIDSLISTSPDISSNRPSTSISASSSAPSTPPDFDPDTAPAGWSLDTKRTKVVGSYGSFNEAFLQCEDPAVRLLQEIQDEAYEVHDTTLINATKVTQGIRFTLTNGQPRAIPCGSYEIQAICLSPWFIEAGARLELWPYTGWDCNAVGAADAVSSTAPGTLPAAPVSAASTSSQTLPAPTTLPNTASTSLPGLWSSTLPGAAVSPSSSLVPDTSVPYTSINSKATSGIHTSPTPSTSPSTIPTPPTASSVVSSASVITTRSTGGQSASSSSFPVSTQPPQLDKGSLSITPEYPKLNVTFKSTSIGGNGCSKTAFYLYKADGNLAKSNWGETFPGEASALFSTDDIKDCGSFTVTAACYETGPTYLNTQRITLDSNNWKCSNPEIDSPSLSIRYDYPKVYATVRSTRIGTPDCPVVGFFLSSSTNGFITSTHEQGVSGAATTWFPSDRFDHCGRFRLIALCIDKHTDLSASDIDLTSSNWRCPATVPDPSPTNSISLPPMDGCGNIKIEKVVDGKPLATQTTKEAQDYHFGRFARFDISTQLGPLMTILGTYDSGILSYTITMPKTLYSISGLTALYCGQTRISAANPPHFVPDKYGLPSQPTQTVSCHSSGKSEMDISFNCKPIGLLG